MKTIAVFFTIESNRNGVEECVMGKTFKDIDALKESCKLDGLEYDGWCPIEEFIIALNSEDYPTDNWVAVCNIEQL